MHRLEPLLRACARAGGDVSTAVSAARAQLQCTAADSSDDELFAVAVRRWNDTKDASVSTFRFLVLVVACEWESQLMQFLLQQHASDAADDMSALVQVGASISQSSAATVVLPVLDAIVATAAAFSLADSRGSQLEDSPSDLLRYRMRKPGTQCPSCSSSRFPLADSVMADANSSSTSDQDRWTRFLELSSGLDARKFDSKTGRSLSSAAAQVIEQQQGLLMLACCRHSKSRADCDDNDDVLREAFEKMQDVMTQALQVSSLCEDVNVCGRCVDSSDADSPSTPGAPTNDKDADEGDFIHDDAALESYLVGKSQLGNTETSRAAVNMDATVNDNTSSKTNHTGFQKLLKALSPQSSLSTHTMSDLVQKTQEELLKIADLEVLGIQISFLLSAQMRATPLVAQLDDEVFKSLTRQVLRELNSLTVGAEDCDRSMRMMTILSGFCPSLVLREIVSRAMTAPQQVEIYVQTLQLCPLLTEWTDEGATPSVLVCELQSSLRHLVSARESFEAQKPHLLALLWTLAGIAESNSTTREPDSTAVLSIQTVVEELLLPVFNSITRRRDGESIGATATEEAHVERAILLQESNCFAFLHDFVHRAASDARWKFLDSGAQTTKTLLKLLLEVYRDKCGPLTAEKVELQNTLLLTMKDLLKFTPPIEQVAVAGILMKSVDSEEETLDEPVLMLVAHFSGDTHGWEELSTLHRLFQDLEERISIDESALDLETASQTIRPLLWKLLWSAVSPADKSRTSQAMDPPFISNEHAWNLLELLAGEFSVVSSGTAISGRALVQKELARLMLMCRTSLFSSLNDAVLPRLVQMLEQPATSTTVKLRLPEQLTLQLSSDDIPTAQSASLNCELPVSHLGLRLVCRSWSCLVISHEHFEASEQELVLQMGRHFLLACDRAVSDSKSSLAGLLNCFQWVCCMLDLLSIRGDRMKKLETYKSITRQLNVTLLRLLHLLSQIQVTSEADASFSQRFVALWMAQLPQDSFEQAHNFLSSAARHST